MTSVAERTRSLSAHAGTSATPRATAREAATMKRLRRTSSSGPKILMPDTTMLTKRKVVMPPSTQYGIELITAEILAMMPKMSMKIGVRNH